MSTLNKIGLDARELEHPKPLEFAMKALMELDDNNYFYMIHRKNPVPLLDLASEQNLNIFTKEDKNSNWHIIICKSSLIDLSELFTQDHIEN